MPTNARIGVKEDGLKRRTKDEQVGYYKMVHRVPCCTREYDDSEWIEYGHTMEEYLGGLIRCGFVLNGYMECQGEDITELNFLARAVKPE